MYRFIVVIIYTCKRFLPCNY